MSKYQSNDNPRDIAEAIEELMFNCIRRYYLLSDRGELKGLGEEAEILKRRITDYLLATDRSSETAGGPNDGSGSGCSSQ